MYSELIKLRIINPEDKKERNYIIDYNGNESIKGLRANIIGYITKHKTFYTDEFAKECLNDLSCIYYLADIDGIEISIPKKVMDISKL